MKSIDIHPDIGRSYDKELDITAGELRELVPLLDPSIPDAAWVPRDAVDWNLEDGVAMKDDRSVEIKMKLNVKVPFFWIEWTYNDIKQRLSTS